MITIKNFVIKINQRCSGVRFNDSLLPLPQVEIKNQQKQKFLSVSEFAKEAHITPQAVRKMISEKRLNANRLGEQYVIDREELNRYLQLR